MDATPGPVARLPARRWSAGAEVTPEGVSFRGWAPLRRSVEVATGRASSSRSSRAAGSPASVPEVFDAGPPHTARGCVAQAWGVAELLRALLRTAG